MSGKANRLSALFTGDGQADRVVPPSGFTAHLTLFASAAMAFLAVFSLTLAFSAGRLADQWGTALARTATVRITAPEGQEAARVDAALRVLETTRGVASSRPLSDTEQVALLSPWLGEGLSLENLPVPRLIEVVETAEGMDVDGLRLRLTAEVPGAVLDDHSRWRAPLARAAGRVTLLGYAALALIGCTVAAMITLAGQAALAANAQVIAVLRLVGATDVYIARAFERRFSLRALAGGFVGTALGAIAVALLPDSGDTGGLLTALRLSGWEWFALPIIPLLAGLVAFLATRTAARRTLRTLS